MAANCQQRQSRTGLVPPKFGVYTREISFQKKMSALVLIAFLIFIVYIKWFSRKTVIWKKVNKYGENKVDNLKVAPGPTPFPVIGSMHLLGTSESPFQSFTELSKTYGNIYSITLGSAQCLVVNNLELIREVLNQNGKFFGGRPDFLRFHKLFAGDRNNCEYQYLFFSIFFINLAESDC